MDTDFKTDYIWYIYFTSFIFFGFCQTLYAWWHSAQTSLQALLAWASGFSQLVPPQQVKHLITSLGWAWICMVWKRSCLFWRNHILVALRTMHPWDLHNISWRPWKNSFWTSSRPQWQTPSSLPTNNIDSINWSASPIDFIFLVYSYIFLLSVPELW